MHEDTSIPTGDVQESMDPMVLDALLVDLKGFGITDCEEIITIEMATRRVRLRISNVSNEDEIMSMLRADGVKGYPWIQQVRCEILARAITWIDGNVITDTTYAMDPYQKGVERPVRLILVDLIRKWGQEVVLALWKIYMVHCQRLEDNLSEQLPDSQLMTEAERRFMSRIEDELVAAGVSGIQEIAEAVATETTGEGAPEQG